MFQVTDLGAVLHMVGGTAASYMIFFLPGLLLINAAIVKRTASLANLAEEGQVGYLPLCFSRTVHHTLPQGTQGSAFNTTEAVCPLQSRYRCLPKPVRS